MPRKNRRNADYFPHPARPGPVEDLVQRRWGNDGYAVYNKMLELLTDTDEHFLDLSGPARMELFVGYMLAPPEIILEVLNSLANLNFIDSELWHGYHVVWCEQLVSSMLAEVYRKREADAPNCPDSALPTRLHANPAQNTLFPGKVPPETTQKEVERDSRESKNSDGAAENTMVEFFYATRRAGKRRKLTGRSLWWFKIFWERFAYKHSRADAVGAWLDLEWQGGKENDRLGRLVCIGAKCEARNRFDKTDRGLTPIFGQGWLSANRFEDWQSIYDRALKNIGPDGIDQKIADEMPPGYLEERPTKWS